MQRTKAAPKTEAKLGVLVAVVMSARAQASTRKHNVHAWLHQACLHRSVPAVVQVVGCR